MEEGIGNEKIKAEIDGIREMLARKGFPVDVMSLIAEKVRERKKSEFYIPFHSQVDQLPVRGGLYFLKDAAQDVYAFRSFNLTLEKESGAPVRKNIFLTENDLSLREANNLMHGREVYKEIKVINFAYPNWLSLGLKEELPGYKAVIYSPVNQLLENTINHSLLGEFMTAPAIIELANSLRQGNRQEISIDVGGTSKKLWAAALPRLGRISLEDSKGAHYDFVTPEQFRREVTKEMRPGRGRGF